MSLERSLGFLFGRHIPYCRENFRKTYADYYTLQYTAGGAVRLDLDTNEYEPLPGQFWSAQPPRTMHIRPRDPDGYWDHRYIAFRGCLAHEWFAAGLLPVEPVFARGDADWAGRFDDILRLSRETDAWSQLRAIDTLEIILVDLAQHQAAHGPQTHRWYRTVVEALTDFSSWPVDYEKLAESAGMSYSTLYRRFHALTGMALHTFALAARMSEAQRLLADSDLPVKEIARRLSFRDLYYFSRRFKRQVGASPREFRASFRLQRDGERHWTPHPERQAPGEQAPVLEDR